MHAIKLGCAFHWSGWLIAELTDKLTGKLIIWDIYSTHADSSHDLHAKKDFVCCRNDSDDDVSILKIGFFLPAALTMAAFVIY